MPLDRISQTLSRYSSLSFIALGWSSLLYLVSVQTVVDRFLLVAKPLTGVHWSRSLMSSSLLLQQCPVGLVRLIRIVFEMRVSGSCTATVLWHIASKICSTQVVAFLCNCHQAFFSIRVVSVHVVHPYSSIDTTTA